jgi:hypothetical protein
MDILQQEEDPITLEDTGDVYIRQSRKNMPVTKIKNALQSFAVIALFVEILKRMSPSLPAPRKMRMV